MRATSCYAVFGALVLLTGCRLGQLDGYTPSSEVTFTAPFRTMAQHDSVMQGQDWPYFVSIPGERALFYYGSAHTSDPSDPQIADIQTRWRTFEPTVAVTENRLGWYIGGIERAVSTHGEFGAVLHLARQDGLPIYSLEPSWDDEVGEVLREIPAAEATLFYTLRVFLSERGTGRSPEDTDALATHLLRKRGSRPGLEGSLPDLAALDALWEAHYADLGPWRTLSPEAMHPNPTPSRLQASANLVNEVRDRHAARVILSLMAEDERVFAIAGGSHVVKQEPVLRAGARMRRSGVGEDR